VTNSQPDDEVLRELGRVTWAAILAESCLRRTCLNLTPAVRNGGQKPKWLDLGRKVLAEAADRSAASEVSVWLKRVDDALVDERNPVMHSDRTSIVWDAGDGLGEPGGLGLIDHRRTTVTLLDPMSLRALAGRLTQCIEGWERVHDVATRIRLAQT
jgi:hypothetical protein